MGYVSAAVPADELMAYARTYAEKLVKARPSPSTGQRLATVGQRWTRRSTSQDHVGALRTREGRALAGASRSSGR
jgi:hypothetical protein